jgi:hypothetical protein
MPSELPSFAAQWVQQWKDAGPRLQAIRDEELRRLGDGPKVAQDSCNVVYDKYPERHGMVMMQKWFMRQQIILRSRTTRDE